MISLLQEFSDFCAANNIIFWLAHGTLLGWFWNKQFLPWDDDIDLQVSYSQLLDMRPLDNTMWKNQYLLELNPHYMNRRHQPNNVIDARFIDTSNGLFVDITALAEMPNGSVGCKSPHYYNQTDITPLHKTTLHGVSVWRPHLTMVILCREYGTKSMIQEYFWGWSTKQKRYYWHPEIREWNTRRT